MLVAIIVVFLLVAIVIATNLSAWTGIVTDAPQGVANLPGISLRSELRRYSVR